MLVPGLVALASNLGATTTPVVAQFPGGDEVEISLDNRSHRLRVGAAAGEWTLMAVLENPSGNPLAVMEDFSAQRGRILVVGRAGIVAEWPKSVEPSHAASKKAYRGPPIESILDSDGDLLGAAILARPGDPAYAEIEAGFPPIARMRTYTFVGTRENFDKVGFYYGGRTAHFDPAAYVPEIRAIRNRQEVADGLVGGWLPVVRFVYPEASGHWTEMLAYAPVRSVNGNNRVQPVWYRVARIENRQLKWARYFDTYVPFPPRLEHPASPFYAQLLETQAAWEREFAGTMRITVPDQRLADMAKHSLVRAMITRVGVYPKYGVFDKDYGGSEHDGFPDTFTADTTAMLEWGFIDRAGQYLDNYFARFVRDDGSILYRGPETGQYGRMLTVVAQYLNYGGDPAIVLRHRTRIEGVAKLLLALRRQARELPADHPAHGMIAGWSEADSSFDPDPPRYMRPYFGNSTEAARGFRDLGQAWEHLGRETGDTLVADWGRMLVREANLLRQDLHVALERSVLADTTPVCLPAIAGVVDPFHVAVPRDKLDPLWRGYRSYMEMLYSGNLSRPQVELIVRYRAAHRDTILGIPTAYGYNTHELAGFLTYGHGYGLLQHDFTREFLLTLYSIMAHQHTRGTWTAPETRSVEPAKGAAPYCTPAQLVVPMFARWMLVFEDPESAVIWLAKGAPRDWFQANREITVVGAPTRYGRIGYRITSRLAQKRIDLDVQLPAAPVAAALKIRLRVPAGNRIASVSLDGRPWTNVDADGETITLPAGFTDRHALIVSYQ